MTEPIDEALIRLEQAWAQCHRRKEALPRSIGISDPKRLTAIVEQESRSQEAVDQACSNGHKMVYGH
jgi:hypothetical protein